MDFIAEARASFSAGHHLPGTPHAHPHGHAYTVTARMAGPLDPKTGVVQGSDGLGSALTALADELHLRDLNAMLPVAYPTHAGVAAQFMDRLSMAFPVIEIECVDESGEGTLARREIR